MPLFLCSPFPGLCLSVRSFFNVTTNRVLLPREWVPKTAAPWEVLGEPPLCHFIAGSPPPTVSAGSRLWHSDVTAPSTEALRGSSPSVSPVIQFTLEKQTTAVRPTGKRGTYQESQGIMPFTWFSLKKK